MNSTTESETRGRFDRRFLGIGAGSGLLGGICCIGSAIAVGLGVSAISFFGAWMDRYQIYFIHVSVALMILWLVRTARPYGFSRQGIRLAARVLARQALVMTIIYATTLAVTVGISMLVRGM